MTRPEPHEIEPGLFLIDHHFQGMPGVIASYLLLGDDGATLIETGPSSTLDTLLAGIRAAGCEPASIRRVVVTHIHLDHAGAAGTLMRQLPDARLYVHPVGGPHLVDPSRLVASATRIYGDAMDRLWGEICPVPAERVRAIADGEEILAGRRRLVALDTPGHANHHHAFYDREHGLLFTGDIAGIRLSQHLYVYPPTPPPEVDLQLWMQSVARVRELHPRRLLLTHFGSYGDVEPHLDELLTRLFFWGGWVAARQREGTPPDAVAIELRRMAGAELRELTGEEELARFYEVAAPYGMTATGLDRYFRKREERTA